MRETHEKLKVGNVELLNCYYAHAAENDRFQRRCYWLLDSDEGVVMVHYLDTTMVVGSRGGAKGGATNTMQPNTQPSDSGTADGGDRNGFRNLFRYASGASQMSGSGYDEGSMSMGGEMPASPMMHSPARVSVQGGSYHPEVYANSHPYGVVGGSFSQHQHGGVPGHGVMPSHYPHGGSDPHALYNAAQEQFNGAESESWFNSVLASGDETEDGAGRVRRISGNLAVDGTLPARAPSSALPFKQNSNRSLDLGSMGIGPPMDGYFGMEHDAGEVSTSPHFDLLHEFAVDQMAAVKVEGMPVEGMPADSAVAAAAVAAAAGPNIGTAFPGEGTDGVADGIASMAELEDKIASLKETLISVASVNAAD